MPLIQLALDFAELKRAVDVAKDAKNYVDIIEAGTPLIKSEGLNAVRTLKKEFPKHIILADMKTMDTGSFEVEIASKAGADIIGILAVSSNSTLKEGVKAAKRYGTKIMTDLIGCKNYVRRAKELEKFGVDYLCIHVGIDEQMSGKTPLKILREIQKEVKIPIAVAGGINQANAKDFSKADIIIVGGAITKSQDPKKSAREMKAAIKIRGNRKFEKVSEKETAIQLLSKTPCANIADAMQKEGVISGLRRISPGKLVGTALTVKCYDGDWSKSVQSIDLAKKGDVIVIECFPKDIAVWGGLATLSAKKRGINGLVIDGCVRDTAEIVKLNFPVYAKMTSPLAGNPKGRGEIGTDISVCGTKVSTGDLIIADSDGIVVVPSDKIIDIANRTKDINEREERIVSEIKNGSTLGRILNLKRWEVVR